MSQAKNTQTPAKISNTNGKETQINEIQLLKKSYLEIKQDIQKKLTEFKNLPEQKWLLELIFCLLTPQSNAHKCWEAVILLEQGNYKNIENILRTKTRFYRTKAKHIKAALKNWPEIKKAITSLPPKDLREYLYSNVNGLGMKESSHFIRNIGKNNNNLAILDRHIIKNLLKYNAIPPYSKPNKKSYLEIEEKMKAFSEKISIPLDELDLLLWQSETGEIFK